MQLCHVDRFGQVSIKALGCRPSPVIILIPPGQSDHARFGKQGVTAHAADESPDVVVKQALAAWKTKVDTGPQGPVELIFDLKAEGNKLKGTLSGPILATPASITDARSKVTG